ncbi:MFS transporter [Actinomycetospora termitidis]|uniref:Lysosomal dipeptide transporter MFSD1 n=1 Tax=Actinomycetospora termitidis TaxID=3053470 RepID=A0ABT7MBY1_9PSEU|nr:MFS transporter [Actinomycetospora sp. Odt1-22]MDL5158148.1 MFS transporter [Actinomycetospora sp. Odt1-22]
MRLLVWGTAVLAYVCSVIGRSALAATGPVAAERFEVSAGVLSLLAVLSLGVYAALQIPAGVLVDRFGPKLLISGGAVLVTVGQALLALAPTFPVAVLGRVLAGAGDAVMFVSVLRLVPTWFAPRRVPLVNQLSGILGQLGQAVSAIPLAGLVVASGWTAAYLVAAGASGIVAVVAALVIRPGPIGSATEGGGARLREVIATPGARLGFWCHFAAPFSANVFGLLWGYPFLTTEGVPVGLARVLVSGVVVVTMVFGPLFGLLSGRFPHRRVELVGASVVAQTVAWAVVLAWPGPAPVAVLVVLVIVLASGGSASLVAFDVARSSVSSAAIGRASGLTNVGGFVSGLAVVALVGVLLDLQGAGSPDSWTVDVFRVAMAVHVPVLLIGLGGMWWSRRRVRVPDGGSGRLRESAVAHH